MNPKEQWDYEVKQDYIEHLKQTNEVFTYEDLLDKLIDNSSIQLESEIEQLYHDNPKLFYATTGYDLFEKYIDDNIGSYTPATTLLNFNYTALPDNVIRTVLIYHVAASYLEEEDEFESQYKTYMSRAEDSLQHILHTYYSVYKTNIFDLDKPDHHHLKQHNPYWIDGDD